MLVFASWHHRSLKFNIGREGTQLFVGIWVLKVVSQLNVTRIVVITKGYGVRATTIEGQNGLAPTLCFAYDLRDNKSKRS